MINSLTHDFNIRFNLYKDELLNNYKALCSKDELFQERFSSLVDNMQNTFNNGKSALRTLALAHENDSF